MPVPIVEYKGNGLLSRQGAMCPIELAVATPATVLNAISISAARLCHTVVQCCGGTTARLRSIADPVTITHYRPA
jgi:hypothetical protein